MATFTLNPDDGRNLYGNRRGADGIYTGPASYATGGDPISASDFGLSDLRFVAVATALDVNNSNLRIVALNRAANKLIWIVPNTNAEVANGTNLSGYTTTIFVMGR